MIFLYHWLYRATNMVNIGIGYKDLSIYTHKEMIMYARYVPKDSYNHLNAN